MKAEQFIFKFVQDSLAYQAEIRNIFFVFAAPHRAPFLAADDLEPHVAHALLLLQAMPEPRVAGTKNSSQHTVAGRFRRAFPACAAAQSKSLALRAGFFRYRDSFRTIPLKIHEYFLPVLFKICTECSFN
jgi:hypothetical protein